MQTNKTKVEDIIVEVIEADAEGINDTNLETDMNNEILKKNSFYQISSGAFKVVSSSSFQSPDRRMGREMGRGRGRGRGRIRFNRFIWK